MSDDLIDKLCVRWKAKLPEVAIVTAVHSVFPELRQVEPPVDLRRITSKRDVVGIRRVEMAPDGTISLTDGSKYIIKLNKMHSVSRQRFTIGHEIGHTFFFELEDGSNVRSRLTIEDNGLESLSPNQYEESLCNIAAAEILMPHLPFCAKVKSVGTFANGLLTLSQLFRTSLWATARRAVQVSPFNLIIALWEYQPSTEIYRTAWVVQSNRKQINKQFVVNKQVPIFKTFETSAKFRGRRWVSLDGPIDDYFVDGLVLNGLGPKRILTVFILERSAEQLVANEIRHIRTPTQLQLFGE